MPSPCSVLVWALLLSLNASYVAGKEVDSAVIRTIGGEKAADVWVPRFVFNHKTICAGVTLTAEADLTSATCLSDDEPLDAFVVVESHGQKEPPVQVAHIDRCVKFDKSDQHVHDLMVCFHHCQWNFSDDVVVPRINLESDRVPSQFDKTCIVMGFGHMTPDGDKCNMLHTLEINVGASQDCGSQDNTVHNYICGATTEQRESCAVDGGEPLLCQDDTSKFFIHGICKQQDCSAHQKYSKFILLSYYREWLLRTVPSLAPSSGSQEEASSHGDTKADNNQTMGLAGEEAEKCPLLPHSHQHSLTKERGTPGSSDDTSSSTAVPSAPQSGDVAALGESGNATPLDTSSADVVHPNEAPLQTSPATVVPQNSEESVLNVTVLLASLGDGWYLSNATHSAPHLSDGSEKLDIDQLEKLISDNGTLLKFSYVVDSRNLSLAENSNRSVETSEKLPLPAGNELAKSGADSPNSIASTQVKSTDLKAPDGAGKPVDSSNPKNVLPSDGVTPERPPHGVDSSAKAPHSLNIEPSAITQTVPPNTLTLTPTQWDWLKQNAMRLPKNPLKNPKVLGKNLLFKPPRHKYDPLSRAPFPVLNRREKEPMTASESPGFPSNYREKWSARAKSYSRLHPSYSLKDYKESSQTPGKGVLKRGLSSSTARDENFRPPTLSRIPKGLSGGRPQRSLPDKISGKGFERASLSRDIQHTHPAITSPTLTSERTEGRHASSSSVDRRQPEGTFFGVISSTVKTRLRRSDGHDEPSEWKTLLADLASWPAHVGIAPSPLTPRVSFLTSMNLTPPAIPVDVSPGNAFRQYFKLLRAFLPGGNVARRIDMYRKELIWGPRIIPDEITQLKPWNKDVVQEEEIPAGRYFDGDEDEAVASDSPGSKQSATDEPATPVAADSPGSEQSTTDEPATPVAADQDVRRKRREAKNYFPTTPGTETQHGADSDDTSAEQRVKNGTHTTGGHGNSYNGSTRGTNVSDQTDSAIGVGTVGAGKETILPAVDAGKETRVPAVDIGKETTLSAVYTQKETLLPTVDTRKEAANTSKEDTISPVNKENDTVNFTTDVQKETTLPKVDTGREASGGAETVSTPHEVDAGKVNLWTTVRSMIEVEGPSEERNSTSVSDDDTDREQADFYEEIKRLGANAGHRLTPVSCVALALVITWIYM